MTARDALTADQVLRALDYDPETGVFTWRQQPLRPKEWNTRWAGKRAGSFDAHGYVNIHWNGRTHKAHRLAWLVVHGRWPAGDIDHANRVRSDNRITNLRECSRAENMQNQGVRSDNATGLAGISFCKDTKRWRAKIKVDGEQIHLGRFDTPEAAHDAYRLAKGGLHSFHHTIEASQS